MSTTSTPSTALVGAAAAAPTALLQLGDTLDRILVAAITGAITGAIAAPPLRAER